MLIRYGMTLAKKLVSDDENPRDACLRIILDLVLPNPDDCPAHPAQLAKIPLIPGSGRRNLVSPIRRQLVFPEWKPPPMPKIPVDEYGKLDSTKDDVWSSRQFSCVGRKIDLPPP